jgi:hypothetical protein
MWRIATAGRMDRRNADFGSPGHERAFVLVSKSSPDRSFPACRYHWDIESVPIPNRNPTMVRRNIERLAELKELPVQVKAALMLVSAVSFLVGCTSVDVSPSEALGTTAKQLGIDPISIVLQTPARFAVATPGDRYADFKLGLYTQTKTEVDLFEYNSAARTFSRVQTVPLKDIRSVSIATWGMFGQIHQVQLAVADKVVVLNCNNSSDAVGGSGEKTQPVIDRLVAAGVSRGGSAARVLPGELQYYSTPVPILKK